MGADSLEGNLIRHKRERFLNVSGLPKELERKFRKSLESLSARKAGEGSRIDAELNRIRSQIKSLVRLAEEGVQVEEIAQRIRQLEAERKELEQLTRRLENTNETEAAINQVAKAAEEYFQEFDLKFDTLPVSMKKSLLQKVVERIQVDQETRMAKCYLRKLPKGIGNPALDLLRTQVMRVPPTGFEPVFQA
jgi:DNA-binding FrmR family transcriptional regulator